MAHAEKFGQEETSDPQVDPEPGRLDRRRQVRDL